MKRIRDTFDFERLDQQVREAAVRMESERQRKAALYGWDANCECHDCGDTGFDPETQELCWCDEGRNLIGKRERHTDWDKMIPSRLKGYRLDTHPHKTAVVKARQWVDMWGSGTNLLIHGDISTGKTGLAVGAIFEIFAQYGPKFVFSTFPDILEMMRPKSKDSPAEYGMSDFQNVPLLVIDDLGAEKTGEWVDDRLYLIANDRFNNERPTVVTTNLSPKELQEKIGDRAFSRITYASRVIDCNRH